MRSFPCVGSVPSLRPMSCVVLRSNHFCHHAFLVRFSRVDQQRSSLCSFPSLKLDSLDSLCLFSPALILISPTHSHLELTLCDARICTCAPFHRNRRRTRSRRYGSGTLIESVQKSLFCVFSIAYLVRPTHCFDPRQEEKLFGVLFSIAYLANVDHEAEMRTLGSDWVGSDKVGSVRSGQFFDAFFIIY